jgi:hypothetical protein
MNKKLFGFMFSIIVLAVLTAPVLGAANTGKGQTRVSFRLVIVGTYGGTGVEKDAGQSVHIDDLPFALTGWEGSEDYPDIYDPIVLEIDGVPVDPALLSYEGMMKVIYSEAPDGESGQPNMAIMVDETITIGEAGTLVLQNKGNNQNTGNGVGAGDSFIGFGTDDYKGVKIQGRSPGGAVKVGEIEPAPGVVLPISKLERVGTVMGWPT